MERIFLRVLNMSITASFLLAAVIILRLIAKKKLPKWIFCVLWALAAVRLVCPITVESPLSLVPDRQIVTEQGFWSTEQRGPVRDRVQGASTLNPNFNETKTDGSDAEGFGESQVINNAGSGQIKEKSGKALFKVLGVVWLCGMASLVCYAVISYIRLRRRTAASAAVGKQVWQSDEISTPFVLGVVRPHIYLPSGLDSAQTEYVLAHERMHLKRHDHWWKPLGFAVLSVHWFNPICWVSYILFCRDIELACDEGVVRKKDEQYKKSYAEALLACSVGQRGVNACPLAFGETDVKERIGNVMNYKKPAFWVILTAIAACIVVAVCFLTNPQKKEEQTQNAADPENTNERVEVVRTDSGGEDRDQENGQNGTETESETKEPIADEQNTGNGMQGNEDNADNTDNTDKADQNVPGIVWQQAQQYVQAAFDLAAENDRNNEPASASYTDWRIQSIEHCYTYDHIAGMICEIYRLDYEFLAESPEQVELVGGMQMSEDGWIVPESPGHYLVFGREGDTLTYVCSMYENDCMPGDELFTSDLTQYCLGAGMHQNDDAMDSLATLAGYILEGTITEGELRLQDSDGFLQYKNETDQAVKAIIADAACALLCNPIAGLNEEESMMIYAFPIADTMTFSNTYGCRIHPVDQNVQFHSGMDFAAEKGTPVLAAAEGCVYRTGMDSANGNYVILIHRNGECTYYTHCDSVIVEIGDIVACGQQIATVGNTGKSTGSHLHFAVSGQGAFIQPSILESSGSHSRESETDIQPEP